MEQAANPVSIFIGSSSEGLEVARNLQSELEARCACEVVRWDTDVFEPSGYSLDSLIAVSKRVDFAILVATPDDLLTSRDVESHSVRDNVVLEFGLFAGALGRERTYLLTNQQEGVKLPTDVLGLTRLTFRTRSDRNLRAAMNDAVLEVEKRLRELGHLSRHVAPADVQRRHGAALRHELELLKCNADAQGWLVRTDSPTTFRLRSPRGTSHTLSKGTPATTRERLRLFAREVRNEGLRVNRALRGPVEDSPF